MNQTAPQERRATSRKPFRRRISVTLPNGTVMQGHTIDLTAGGVRAAIREPVDTPQECTFELAFMLDGKPRVLNARGRILSCVCTGMIGFSVGIQFVKLDEAAKGMVAALLG